MGLFSTLLHFVAIARIVPANCLLLAATKQQSNYSTPIQSTSASSRVNTVAYDPSRSELSSTREESMHITVAHRRVPKLFYHLNAATKWLVSLAVSVGVFWNPRHFRGPYIVVGSIAANYVASVLKKIIDQGRPDGAPFTDPGMPSSHALVSFFVAIAWSHALDGLGTPWFIGSAVTVSSLRVICGYHTFPQIAVGGTLGSLLGHAWMSLGVLADKKHRKAAHILSWSAYVIGSAIYIKKNVMRWLTDEKYL